MLSFARPSSSNDGVEHMEVAKAINETLMKMDMASADVPLFIEDAASILTAASANVLRPLFLDTMPITCPSHGLNGVGKAMVAELRSTSLRSSRRPLAKRYASRRRRWFAHLKANRMPASLPPKYFRVC